jgi:hypothetical protein
MGVKIEVSNADYIFNLNSGISDIADNYVAATGITDPTQITAIENFSKSLIYNGIYGKFKAMWLFVGDTYDKCKINFINNSLYTLPTIPIGNINNGLDLSTLTGLNTGFLGDDALMQDGHLSFYNSTPETNATTIALHDVTASNDMKGYGASRNLASKIYFGVKGPAPAFTYANRTEVGLFVGTQLNDFSNVYSKGVLVGSVAHINTGSPVSNLTIGTTTAFKSSMKLQLVSVGESLTQNEITVYNLACEQFMTDLGR